MNYEKLYFAFMEKYKNQEFDVGVYTEVHHIIPRHAGGDDSKENLIRLDYRQHCFAHRLLWKAYGKAGDYKAWVLMTNQEVDAVLATHKALGQSNVASGHLERIREFANTPVRQEKLRKLNQHKVDNKLWIGYLELAREAWTGQKHTEEWKALKCEQMQQLVKERPEQFSKLAEVGRKAKTEQRTAQANAVIENAERNEEFLHKRSSHSKNIFVSPEGLEFDSATFAAKYYGKDVKYFDVDNWCKRGQYGWSRKPKAAED